MWKSLFIFLFTWFSAELSSQTLMRVAFFEFLPKTKSCIPMSNYREVLSFDPTFTNKGKYGIVFNANSLEIWPVPENNLTDMFIVQNGYELLPSTVCAHNDTTSGQIAVILFNSSKEKIDYYNLRVGNLTIEKLRRFKKNAIEDKPTEELFHYEKVVSDTTPPTTTMEYPNPYSIVPTITDVNDNITKVVSILSVDHNLSLIIETASDLSIESNEDMAQTRAQLRAEYIRALFMAKGVDRNQIETSTFGSAPPDKAIIRIVKR